jgi:hypothetical protein
MNRRDAAEAAFYRAQSAYMAFMSTHAEAEGQIMHLKRTAGAAATLAEAIEEQGDARRIANVQAYRAEADAHRATAAAWGGEPHIQAAMIRRAEAADQLADIIEGGK